MFSITCKSKVYSQMPIGTDLQSIKNAKVKKQKMISEGVSLESANEKFFKK